MVTRAIALAALLALACDKEGEESAGSGPTWPGASAADISRALEAVPDSAFAVAVLSAPKPFWGYLLDYSVVPMPADSRGALDKDLRAVLGGQLGLDLTRSRAAIGFAVMPMSGAALLRDVSGALKAGATEGVVRIEDDLVVGHRGETLSFGAEPAVRAAIDLAGGKGKNLVQGNPELARWVAEQGTGSWVIVAGSLKNGPPMPEPLAKIDRFALFIGPRKARVVAEGEPAALQQIARQLDGLVAMGMAQADEMRSSALKGEIPAPLAAASVYQYHHLKNVAARVKPVVSGNRLTIEAPVDLGDNAMILVAMVGMTSAVAIPAFMKYIKKSKGSEAQVNLMRLRAGVENHLLEHGRLPAAAGPTPPVGSCCAAGDRCAPAPGLWEQETWRALRFSMDDPHRYSYELVTEGDRYTVRAYGDLDCDGTYSTFSLSSDGAAVQETDPLE